MLRVVRPRPAGNSQSGKFAKSENLLRRFKKDVKKFHLQKLNKLIGRKLAFERVGLGMGLRCGLIAALRIFEDRIFEDRIFEDRIFEDRI